MNLLTSRPRRRTLPNPFIGRSATKVSKGAGSGHAARRQTWRAALSDAGAGVLTETVTDRKALQSQRAFTVLRELRQQARASFVGTSEVGWQAPLHRDGFMTDADISALVSAGAVGEITRWSFDAAGRPLDSPVNDRVASLTLEIPPKRVTVVVGGGPQKVAPLKAALKGRLALELTTDEATAAALIAVTP